MLSWTLYPFDNFEKWVSSWDKLNKEHVRSALLDSRFIRVLLDHYGEDKIRLAVGYNRDAIVAMTFVRPQASGVWSTFQPSQAPLGLWLAASEIDPAMAAQSLLRALPGYPLLFSVLQQDPDFAIRPKSSPQVRTIDYILTARILVDGEFNHYWSSRGKNLRHNLKRQRNRLQREGIALRLEVLADPEHMSKAIHDYGNLESVGWKNKFGTAISGNNRQGEFYRNVLEIFSKTGDARAYQYYYNDELVASDLCIIGYGSANWIKTTYNEQIKTSSPAALMRQAVFEQLFDEPEIHIVEFYGPVMDWHTKWADDMRTLYHINHYRWPGLANIHSMLRSVKRTVFGRIARQIAS